MSDTCGQCAHFRQFHGEAKGECFRWPPERTYQGFAIPRSQVRVVERACGEFRSNSGEVDVKEKVLPETPGQAAREWRKDRKRGR